MSKIISIRGLAIGGGRPVVCAPLTGQNPSALMREAAAAQRAGVQMAEWRADYLAANMGAGMLPETLRAVRGALGELPLLFTLRSARENGQYAPSAEEYIKINREAAASGLVDFVDLELDTGADVLRELMPALWADGVKLLLSNHDFNGTPPASELTARLRRMRELGADIVKVAAMPREPADLFALLSASAEASAALDCPVIAISMGREGMVSRVFAELYGSAITFGALENASAPGQLAAETLGGMLDALHTALANPH